MATERRRMRQLSATGAEWTAANPTLLEGEIGFDTTAMDFKVGPGAWDTLPFFIQSQGDSRYVRLSGGVMTGSLAVTNPTPGAQGVLLGQNGNVTGLNIIAQGGSLSSRNDLNPAYEFRNAAGVIQGLIYLNRGNAAPQRPGIITVNGYNPDGTNARIIARFDDNIANGGALTTSTSVVTREHGDVRYGQLAVGNAWVGDQTIAGRLRSVGAAQERARLVQTVGRRGLEIFASNLAHGSEDQNAFVALAPVINDVTDFNAAIRYYAAPASEAGWYIGNGRVPANRIQVGAAAAVTLPAMTVRASAGYTLGELWQNAVAGVTWPAVVSFVGGNNQGGPSTFVVEISQDAVTWFRVDGDHTNSDNNQWGGNATVPPNWFVRARRESGSNTAPIVRTIQY